jgi:type I restriction enzyme, S subunit
VLKSAEWCTLPLSEVAEIHDNLRLPINATERTMRIDGKAEADLFPYYGATGQVGWIDDFRMEGRYVLVGEDGAPFLDPFARKAYIVEGRTWVNNHAHILRGKPDILDDWFLKYALDVTDYRAFVNGTTRLKLTQGSLREIPIRLPSIGSQRRIVARVDELFTELDDGEEELRRARAELETYRKSLLKAAVTGELTVDWRAANPPNESGADLLARILTDRRARWEANPKNKGKSYREPVGPEAVNLPALPQDWTWASLTQLADLGTGSTPSRSEPDYWNGDVPWLKSGCVNQPMIHQAEEFISNAAVKAHRLKFFEPGTLLIALYGEGKTRGKTTVLAIRSTISQALGAVAVIEIEPLFVKAVLDSDYQKNRVISSGGVQPNFNMAKLAALAIPLPSLAEQGEIVEMLSAATAAGAEIGEAETNAAADSRFLRQSILAAAFRGELGQ